MIPRLWHCGKGKTIETVESSCQELERRMGWTGGTQRCLGSETVLYDTQWWTHVIIHLSKPRKCTLQRVTPNGNSGLQLITMHRIGHNGASPMADKESACNAGDTGNAGLILGSGRSPGVGSGNLFQYSCLENPMVRGAWQDIYSPRGCKELRLHNPWVGEGNGNPLQYSCLENPMDGRAW